jgi:hypothetical protein
VRPPSTIETGGGRLAATLADPHGPLDRLRRASTPKNGGGRGSSSRSHRRGAPPDRQEGHARARALLRDSWTWRRRPRAPRSAGRCSRSLACSGCGCSGPCGSRVDAGGAAAGRPSRSRRRLPGWPRVALRPRLTGSETFPRPRRARSGVRCVGVGAGWPRPGVRSFRGLALVLWRAQRMCRQRGAPIVSGRPRSLRRPSPVAGGWEPGAEAAAGLGYALAPRPRGCLPARPRPGRGADRSLLRRGRGDTPPRAALGAINLTPDLPAR